LKILIVQINLLFILFLWCFFLFLVI